MIPIILIFSFLFEGLYSSLVRTDTFLCPLFTLVSLILIYPYFNKKNNGYYKICFLVGFLYDLIYTDTIIFNAFIFVLLGFVIVKLNGILANNYVNNSIMALVIIIIFRSITYFALFLTDNMEFSYQVLFAGIYNSLFSNIIYVSFGYILTDSISRKLKIQKST